MAKPVLQNEIDDVLQVQYATRQRALSVDQMAAAARLCERRNELGLPAATPKLAYGNRDRLDLAPIIAIPRGTTDSSATTNSSPQGSATPKDGDSAQPLVVTITVNLRALCEFNALTFTGEVDLELVYVWSDWRLVGKTQVDMEKVWKVLPTLANAHHNFKNDEPAAYALVCSETGRVEGTQAKRGTFRQRFDLSNFPFDFHRVEVIIDLQGQGLPSSMVKLKAGHARFQQDVDGLAEWRVEGYGLFERELVASYENYSQLVLTSIATRLPFYYLVKVYLLFCVSSAISFTVYWIPVGGVGDRISLLATMFTANAALTFVASMALPKCSFFTRLDCGILVNFAISIIISTDVIWGPASIGEYWGGVVLFVGMFLGGNLAVILPPMLEQKVLLNKAIKQTKKLCNENTTPLGKWVSAHDITNTEGHNLQYAYADGTVVDAKSAVLQGKKCASPSYVLVLAGAIFALLIALIPRF